jgi:NDP-sugar pyrophosphorylase family protein
MVNAPISAVVLAGGKGTRIAEMFPQLPKPLVTAMGEPFLHWITKWLERQGVSCIILSVGHQAEKVESWAAVRNHSSAIDISCKRETVALGTGGAIRNCLTLCEDRILVCNGDSLIAADVKPYFDLLDSDEVDGVLFGIEVDDTSRYGKLDISSDGSLKKFIEKSPGRGLVNAGIYYLKRHLVEDLPDGVKLSMEHDVIPELLAKGYRLRVVSLGRCKFLDIGTPETVTEAGQFISNNRDLFA